MPIHHRVLALVALALVGTLGCAALGGARIYEREDDGEPAELVFPPRLPDGVSPGWEGPSDDPADAPWTEPGELPQVLAPDGVPLPLRHTDVHADVRGHVADVVVTQTFVNDRTMPIEVVYTFPLPENAAVWDLRMVVGERIIASEVRTRQQATAAYQAARTAGYTAALLEQQRPNVFTQRVANIEGGATIEVEIHYLQTLSFDAGSFELVFPMVVAPRYLPGAPQPGGTDRVPDGDAISPPVVPHGLRAGDDIAITVDIDAGGTIEELLAPTYAVREQRDGARTHVELAEHDALPNRDFVLRWRPTAGEVRTSLFVGPPGAGGEGYFELLVLPPTRDVDAELGRRELVFVLDVSGSMSGEPLALEKMLLRQAVADLRPVDTFDVVTFAGAAQRLFERPQPANAARIADALAFVDGLDAAGGTEMLAGVALALDRLPAPGRNRYVVFMTDGDIGDEAQLFAGASAFVRRMTAAHRVARVFAVAVGSSPNRHLTTGLARAGAGISMWIHGREDPSIALAAIERVIDVPVLTDVEIDFAGADVRDVFPSETPDLFASHVLVVHGRYRGELPSRGVVVRARARGRTVTLPVQVMPTPEHDATLARLWAREQIAELETRTWIARDPVAVRNIEVLGIAHHLVTPYTSLLAIDRSRRANGDAASIVQPTHAPEGVDVVRAGGRRYLSAGMSMRFRRSAAGSGSASVEHFQMANSSDSPSVMFGPRPQPFEPSLIITIIRGGERRDRVGMRRWLRAGRVALQRCLVDDDHSDAFRIELRMLVREAKVHAEPRSNGKPLAPELARCIAAALGTSTRDVTDGTYQATLRWSGK
jgi:Ca-activated chloride channel homolog